MMLATCLTRSALKASRQAQWTKAMVVTAVGNSGRERGQLPTSTSLRLTPSCLVPLTAVTRHFSVCSLMRQANSSSSTSIEASAGSETPLQAPTAAAAPASGASEGKQELILGPELIPERPVALEQLDVSALEPTLNSLGLASWWPSGRLQYLLECLHVDLDLPWWACIIVATVCMRLLTFPLVVMAQKNAALLANYAPQMQELQMKMTDARRRGDLLESNQLGLELQKLMKEKGINPLKNMMPMFMQLPIFMSMFFGLRGMTNLPLESLMDGGVLWFTDLTLNDPFYALPAMTAASMYLQFKFAADGANLDQAGPILRGFLKFMPLLIFPLTMNFPAAITFYWLTTNVFSVAQAKFVRIPAIRRRLDIPPIVQRDPSSLPYSKKGFRESIRESIDNWKVQADIADRRAYDEAAFREAGMSKPTRTFSYDPTKPRIKKRARSQ